MWWISAGGRMTVIPPTGAICGHCCTAAELWRATGSASVSVQLQEYDSECDAMTTDERRSIVYFPVGQVPRWAPEKWAS